MASMARVIAAVLLVMCLAGCQSQLASVPRETYEGQHEENYRRIFKSKRPEGVTVLNSIVVASIPRKNEVITEDYEIEMVAPGEWITKFMKSARLMPADQDPSFRQELLDRRDRRMRPWYSPKPIDAYQVFRGPTGPSEIHLLVDKVLATDGRYRVFVSRH